MKVSSFLIPLALSVTLAGSLTLSGCTDSVNASGSNTTNEESYLTEAVIDSMPTEELSEAETSGLIFMR